MVGRLHQLIQSRHLVWAWTSRIVGARYQQSVLGGLWMIAQPVATVLIFTVVFTMFVPVDTGGIPYVVFSYVSLVPWMLFSNSLTDMADSLVDNMRLLTKIYFPREILPVSALLARVLDYLIAMALLLVLILYFGIQVRTVAWLYVPLALIIQLMLILGVGLACAAANVFFRDVRPLLRLGIQLWFYASPIVYPVSLVPERLRPYYYLNPMAGILQAYRSVLLRREVPGPYLLISGFIALGALLAGYWLFVSAESEFADVV